MVQISNKPNINSMKTAADDAEYSSKLLAREGKKLQQMMLSTVQSSLQEKVNFLQVYLQQDLKDLLMVLALQYF